MFLQDLSGLYSVVITAQLEHLRVVKVGQSVLSHCCGIKSSTLHCYNCALCPTVLLDLSAKEHGRSTHMFTRDLNADFFFFASASPA